MIIKPLHPSVPGLSIRLADEHFAAYVLAADFTFEVNGYVDARTDTPVTEWAVREVAPYRKCYGIHPEEFAACLDTAHGAIFVAWLEGRAVGHVVVSTHWNGYAHIDELAVDAGARRSGVACALLDVTQFWAQKKSLAGVMLETQNNNLAACRLYERCGFVVGGVDRLRYRGIDPRSLEVAIFWYRLFAA